MHFKLQSAMEYLMSYGWAILIIVVALAAIISLNLFSPGNFVNNQCFVPNGFSCQDYAMSENGVLQINLLQATQDPINITAVGCNTKQTYLPLHMQLVSNPPTNSRFLTVGANYTFDVQCYAGASAYNGISTSLFTGYLQVNYTDAYTGFPSVSVGTIAVKIT